MRLFFQKKSPAASGFTLIELLVVLLIMGIIAAIAAPSYVTWVNNQRTGSAANKVASALRKAQAQAKATKINREVRFDNNNGNPRIAIVPAVDGANGLPTRIPNASIGNWESLNGDGNEVVELRVDPVAPYQSGGVTDSNTLGGVVFDQYGSVAVSNPNNKLGVVGSSSERIYGIQLSVENRHKRCVLVSTLLGSIKREKDGDCPL